MSENQNSEPRKSAGQKPLCTLTVAALVGALVVALPFLNKPFHIDDTFVLAVTRQICKDPLRPYGTWKPGAPTAEASQPPPAADVPSTATAGTEEPQDAYFNWFADPEPIYKITTNPPFISYWLAPVYALFGASEVALHLAMLPFLLLLGFGTASLSRRFTRESVWPVLFVLFCPAVVVSTNIMRDVPATALATAGIAMFVAGTDRNRWLLVLGGGLLAGLATVTKYSALFVIVILLIYPLLQRKPHYLIGIVPAAAVFALWCVQNQMIHGQIHLQYLTSELYRQTHGGATHIDQLNKLTATLVVTGASFFLVLPLLAGAVRRRDGAIPSGAVIVAVATALLFVAYFVPRIGPQLHENMIRFHFWELLQYELWAVLGSVLVYWLLVAGLFGRGPWWKRPPAPGATDSIFLLLWIVGPYLISAVFVGFPAVRHVLPAVAPVCLLAVRYTQGPSDAPPNRWVGAVFGLALLAQAVVAFWTAAADYGYADSYRRFASDAAERYKPSEENAIWFHGHWGWQHYCTEAGFHQIYEHGTIEEGTAPKPGDIVLEPEIAHRMGMPAGLREHLELIETVEFPAKLGVTTMDWGYAGFYATFGLTSPQRFARGRYYEKFHVYRVQDTWQQPQ